MSILTMIIINFAVMTAIFLTLKYKFPQVYSKVLNVYMFLISKLKVVYRYVIDLNKSLLTMIKTEWQTGSKVLAMLLCLCYTMFFCIQVLIGLAVAASYLACKLTGVCPI